MVGEDQRIEFGATKLKKESRERTQQEMQGEINEAVPRAVAEHSNDEERTNRAISNFTTFYDPLTADSTLTIWKDLFD